MEATKIPAVIVGGGVIGQIHAKWLLASPTCRLTAIIDPLESGHHLAQALGVDHFETMRGLLASNHHPRPHIVYICTPSGLHVSAATEVVELAAPKVVFVEKPFSTDSASGRELVEFARSRGCLLATGHHRRFHPRLAAAKEVIDSGALGQLTAISSTWTGKKNDSYYSVDWRVSRKTGGGPVWTNLVHDVDAMGYLIGARIVTLWAKSTVKRRQHPDVPPEDAVEEGAVVIVEFDNGVVGTLTLCDNVASPYGWETATGENLGIPKNNFSLDTYRLFGTQGTLSAPDGLLFRYDEKDAAEKGVEVGWGATMIRESIPIGDGDPYQNQVEHLGRVAKGLESPRCTGEDGLAAVRVCEGICEAIAGKANGPIAISSN